jgi:hypothetical protein
VAGQCIFGKDSNNIKRFGLLKIFVVNFATEKQLPNHYGAFKNIEQ